MVTVLMFGAVVPSLVPLVINYVDARTDIVVPAQAWFGPVAYLTYRWLRRTYGRERTMQEFLRSCESSPTRTGPPDLEVDRSTRAPDGGELQHAAR
jgi:hypothetical protein